MRFMATTKKWGSSIGVIIPKKVVEELGLSENEEIDIQVKRKPVLGKDLFGRFPEWTAKKTTQQLKNEMREGWE